MNKFNGQWLNQCLRYLIVSTLVLAIGIIPSFAGNKVFYYHTDAAGTPVAMSDANGDVVWRADYMPFGEEHEITGSVKNKRRFIGKEKDEETDLYYFGARYLDARTGRFIKPDPVGIREADLLNPQRLNRYSYSLNNPYRYVDPDGNIPLPLLIIPVVTAIIGGNLMTPDVANTPTTSADIHEGPSDLDVLVGTATGAAIGTTIVGKGVAAAGKEIVEEVTGVPALSNKGLGNPFKGKKPEQIDKMFKDKGFEVKGPNPINGKGGYVNPKTGRSYHIDPGGTYKRGVEQPHIDVNRPRESNLPKKKYPIGE